MSNLMTVACALTPSPAAVQYEGIPVPRLGEIVTAHLQPQPLSEIHDASTPPVNLVSHCILEALCWGELAIGMYLPMYMLYSAHSPKLRLFYPLWLTITGLAGFASLSSR